MIKELSMKKNVNRRFDFAVAKKTPKTTTLRLESLESRDLLSVAPYGEPLAPNALVAYESNVASSEIDVLDLSSALADATEGATSIVVTSALDVVDASDGVVTLREALANAQSGDTITFASSLKNQTIAIDSNLGELVVNQSVTIDASSLWNATTAAPGLTISGQDASGILSVVGDYDDEGVPLFIDVEIHGITLTGGIGGEAVYGGAIFSSAATLSLDNCVLRDNQSEGDGGAVCSVDGVTTFTNCVMTNNKAGSVGGATCSHNSETTFVNCTITNNVATYGGGGAVFAAGDGTLTLENCVVSDNSTNEGNGGGVYSYVEETTLVNCLVSGNYAVFGGGLYGAGISLYNCTVAGNSAFQGYDSGYYGGVGGGVFCEYGAFTAYNTIIAGNSASDVGGDVYIDLEVVADGGVAANAYNTLSSFTDWTSGANNLTYDASNPLFTNPTLGWYTLAKGSQVVNKGNNQYVSTGVDQAGNARIVGGRVDLGAYEYQTDNEPEARSTVVSTADDVVNPYDGKISLREAISYAESGATITFANSLKGKTIALNSELGELAIIQSLTIDASNLWNATTSAPGLTIDGQGETRVLSVYQYFYDDANIQKPIVEIDGITFTNGYTEDDEDDEDGSIVSAYSATLSLNNCVIRGSEFENGAALYVCDGTYSLVNCAICDNAGGGLVSDYADTTLVGCSITNNTSDYYGAITAYGETLSLENCEICDNEGGSYGSVYVSDVEATLVNCLVSGNSAAYGGGFAVYGGRTTLYNSAVADNTASYEIYDYDGERYGGYGGGVFCQYGEFYAYNTIIVGNTATDGGDDVYLDPDAVADDAAFANAYNTLSSYSDWTSGANNLIYNSSKPLFTNAASGDYTLANNSQATNKGNNQYVTTFGDLSGNRRVFNGTVDLGPYESRRAPSSVVSETLAKPTGAQEAEKTGTTISIAWDPVANASGYKIAWRNKNDSANSYVTLPVSATSYTLTGLDYGASYYWKVQALGDGVYYADSAYTSARTAATLAPNSPVTVTTAEDVVDRSDGQISLREALEYAASGETITFASSLKGKTIALDPQLGRLATGKTVTIDASNLWNAATSAPGLTVSGQNETGLLCLAAGGDVEINGIRFANSSGYDRNGSGTIDSRYAALSLNNCVICDSGDDALYFYNSVTTLVNCAIVNNSGVGIRASSGSTTLVNCAISNNSDGGIYSSSSSTTLVNCAISNNSDSGIESYRSETTLTNCSITGNTASYGGALYCSDGSTTLTNCAITGNTASYDGGGIYSSSGETTLVNCTIADNTATRYGGGGYWSGSAVLNAYNSIIATNSATNSGDDVYLRSSNSASPVVNARNTLSGFANWTSGANNLTYNASKPLFTNAASGDYTLAENSQAIGKGDNQYVSTTIDLAGRPRVFDGTVDLGAYEYAPVEPEPLATPVLSVADKSDTTITVAWDAIPNAVRYSLSYRLTGTTTWTNKNVGTNTNYTVSGLAPNTEYDFRLKAIGDETNYKSVYSAVLRAKTDVNLPHLGVPTGLTESAKTETTVTVAWNAVANASGYKVAWKKTTDSNYADVTVSASTTSKKLTGLDSSATYEWKVLAVGDGVAYADSAYATARSVKPRQKLAAPTMTSVPAATAITVSWDAVPGASRYYLSYKLASATTWSSNINVGTNVSYTISGLEGETSYDVRIKSIGDNFDYSTSDFASITATTLKAGPQPLATPVLSVADKSDTTITVAWDAIPNAVRYSLSYRLTGTTTWTNKNVGTNTNYTVSGLAPNTEYDFRLKAIGDETNYKSVYSAVLRAKTDATPTPPVGPQPLATPVLSVASKTDTTITVSWDAVPNADRYSLSYKPASETTWTNKNVGTATSYAVTGLTPNTKYDFRLKAIGDGVNYKSVYSAILQAQTDATPTPSGDPIPLATPVLSVASKTDTTITVSWNAVPNADRYSLSYKLASDSTWTNKNVGTSTSYTVSGLALNTEYDFRLKAIGDGVNYKSVYSAVLRVQTDATPTPSGDPIPLATPVLSVASKTDTTITVSWNAVPNADRYSLSYKLASDSTWTNKNVGTSTSYTVSGLALNTEYDFRLKAIGDGVNYKSVYSSIVRAKTTSASSATLDFGAELFDELDEDDYDLLAANLDA